jgi:hypothetical protein
MSGPGTALSDPIAAKIAWAEARYREHRDALEADARIASLIERLGPAARSSHEAMVAAGIVELCAACERDEGGSCCGAGLENRYDGVTLLINLLLGAELPRTRRDPQSCHFLGPRGCLLPARDVICVNFVCQKITDRVPPEAIAPMREREGVELETLFALHSRVTAVLRELADV